jgi:hypothetical protein
MGQPGSISYAERIGGPDGIDALCELVSKFPAPIFIAQQIASHSPTGDASFEGVFRNELALARRVRDQQQRQVGPKVYSLIRPRWNASARQAAPAL